MMDESEAEQVIMLACRLWLTLETLAASVTDYEIDLWVAKGKVTWHLTLTDEKGRKMVATTPQHVRMAIAARKAIAERSEP